MSLELTDVGAPAVFQHKHNLWHYVWKLLSLRIVLYISSFKRAKTGRKILTIFIWVVVLGFFIGVFAASWLLLGFLNSEQVRQFAQASGINFSSLIENIPVLIVAGAFLGILLTSFGVLLQALYLAGDMDFLLCAPIPIRAVFVSKLLQAILPNFGLTLLLGLPVLFGLGLAAHYNFFYFPMVVVVLAALALAAAGLSSLLVMGIVRIFPARRVAEVLGFIGAIISIICSQSGNLINTVNLESHNFSGQQIPVNAISSFNNPWSPLAWAGRGLVDLGGGHWLSGLLFLGLTLGLSSIAFLVSLTTAERLYYTGWASVQVGGRKKRVSKAIQPAAQPTVRTNPVIALVTRILPQDIRSVMWKDFVLIRRDLRNMSQIVTPLIFGLIYAIMLFRTGGEAPVGRGEAPAFFMTVLQSAMIYGNVAISLFVGWSLLSRLALMGFSQEGKNYWMLKSSPISPNHLILAKYLIAYLPSLLLGWLFLLIISVIQRASLIVLGYGLAVVALSIAGTAGLELAFGITGAKLDWEDPRKMQQGTSSCLGGIASMVYLGLTLVLFFGPPILIGIIGLPEILGQGIGLVTGGLLSLAAGFIPLFLVRGRVARIGES